MARVPVSNAPSRADIQNSTYTYAADAEASDAYAITLSPAVTAYAAGQSFLFKANTANTGAATLNVSALGAKTIKKNTDQDLATGDIEAGSIVEVVYDGTNFQMVSVTAVAPGDVVGVAASVDNELPLFSGTGGKTLKRATGTGVVRIDSGVVSIDSDVTDLVSAASDSAAGKVELAIASEVSTGTDTSRAVTPDALAGSNTFGRKTVSIQVNAGDADVATGDGQAYLTIPESLNGMNLVRAQATVVTAGTTNATTIMVHNKTQAADMLSGAISIASAGTVGTVGTIDANNDDVATNDVIRIDVDSVSTTAPKGLVVILEFQLP